MEKRKTLEIPEDFMEEGWTTNKITIKRLSFPETLKVRDQATKARLTESGIDGSVSQHDAAMSTLLKSVIEAPWKIGDIAAYEAVGPGLGAWLLGEVTVFNNITQKKKIK